VEAPIPKRCFEHGNIFYFEVAEEEYNLLVPFSCGYAIKKGESVVYRWTTADLIEILKKKKDQSA